MKNLCTGLILCLFCVFSAYGCSTIGLDVAGVGTLDAESKANIKVYDKIKVQPDEYRHTTIMYIISDDTTQDTKQVKEILQKKVQEASKSITQ